MFGHLGYVPTAHGTDTEGFEALLRLMRDGRAWVKLTGALPADRQRAALSGRRPVRGTLVDAAPERLVWGSDWPHVIVKSRDAERRRPVRPLSRWVPDDEMRRRILVDNPAQLYGFAALRSVR